MSSMSQKYNLIKKTKNVRRKLGNASQRMSFKNFLLSTIHYSLYANAAITAITAI